MQLGRGGQLEAVDLHLVQVRDHPQEPERANEELEELHIVHFDVVGRALEAQTPVPKLGLEAHLEGARRLFFELVVNLRQRHAKDVGKCRPSEHVAVDQTIDEAVDGGLAALVVEPAGLEALAPGAEKCEVLGHIPSERHLGLDLLEGSALVRN